jgi:ribokinase
VDEKLNTGYSVLLLASSGERTVLSYRGASHYLKQEDFSKHMMEADWFYISSLAGNLELLKKLLVHAHKNDIKVALNPGHGELENPRKLRKLLPGVDVLLANREELQLLFGGEKPTETLINAIAACPYVCLTDGPAGSYATDGQTIYFAGQYQKVKVVDRTGAGDAFGSGFVAALAKGGTIEDALTLASANSTSVVQYVGAKPGILHGTRGVKRMKVKRVSI